MEEKTREWLQAEALRRCRTRHGCDHLEAVFIGRTMPRGRNPNWEVLAFKPELAPAAEKAAMAVIRVLRGMYVLRAK
jgi:hypothetical protein